MDNKHTILNADHKVVIVCSSILQDLFWIRNTVKKLILFKTCQIVGTAQQSITTAAKKQKKLIIKSTMTAIPREIADEEVSQYKATHYKIQLTSIKSYLDFIWFERKQAKFNF